ncbi:MAG: apolipoprotein N-acyltransferase [Planctomycetia bacterium]|nr:apolipoprotein N-acyltransferase [Planctomycetia bacterium]
MSDERPSFRKQYFAHWHWIVDHYLLYWMALPPFHFWELAFLAVVPLIPLVQSETCDRKTYMRLWFGGFVFWLFEAGFVRFPHPVNWGLLVALAAYLALYGPLFLLVTRRLTRQKKWPLWLAAPLVWAGGDILRCWVMTGYPMSSLCHAMYSVPILIQTADLVGEWGVDALLVLFSVFLTGIRKKPWKSILGMATVLAFMLGYGTFQLSRDTLGDPVGTVALLQGNIPACLTLNDEIVKKTETQYQELAQEAVAQHADVLVYPESIYRYPVLFMSENPQMPPGLLDETGKPMTETMFRTRLAYAVQSFQSGLSEFVRSRNTAVVTGFSAESYEDDGPRSYNGAIFVSADGKLGPYYAKMHLVPYGEYVPFLQPLLTWFPSLEQYSPIGSGSSFGKTPVAVELPTSGKTLTASLNICFESTVGRLIRRQIQTLRNAGTEPDCLLNVTNNGWFDHSHETQLHLACGVFRAVENRKPFLTAANFGISASIDSNGRILASLETGKPGVVYAQVRPDTRKTLYTRFGWLFLWLPLSCIGWSLIRIDN